MKQKTHSTELDILVKLAVMAFCLFACALVVGLGLLLQRIAPTFFPVVVAIVAIYGLDTWVCQNFGKELKG